MTGNDYYQFGSKALERIAEAPNFNKWMYDTLKQFMNGHVLEIGSGIGNISEYVIADNKSITLSDIAPEYISLLEKKFSKKPQVEAIISLDLENINLTKEHSNKANLYDTIFLLNVLEHIDNHELAIQNIYFLLKPGGTIIILVPAYNILFSKMDQLLGHYRRYTTSSLAKLITEKKFKIDKSFYFNLLGIAGWSWNKVFNNDEISNNKMSLYNKLVPLAKCLDKICINKIGLSAVVVAKKL